MALLLALLMTLTCTAALAENTKHERVYAVTGADGALKSLTDNIRLENAEGLDEITDRTMLTDLENVNGEETFALQGEALTWKAGGKDITYQGTSEKPLPVTPVVTLRMDGEEITAEAMKEKTGRAELTVAYTRTEAVPHLALTILLLPERGVSNLTLENALQLSMAGRRAVVGWGVPGADEALKLPDSFTVSFDADRVELDWMMTFATAEPVEKVWREVSSRIGTDVHGEMDEAFRIVEALEKGEALPETTGMTKGISPKINELNAGLTALNDGAGKLAEGAGALSGGLTTLSENSEALNTGAEAIFAAILNTANQQIQASLSESGLTMPELTAENYREVLTTGISEMKLLGVFSEQARTGAESLEALMEQLGQVETFVSGVHAYTGGVDQAAEGAKQLAAGAVTLHDEGTETLRTEILGAEEQAAGKILPWMEKYLRTAVRVYEETGAQVSEMGYDLRPEGMKTVTLYIIRTDL